MNRLDAVGNWDGTFLGSSLDCVESEKHDGAWRTDEGSTLAEQKSSRIT